MRQEDQGTFDASVSPFSNPETLEPILSTGLIWEGRVAGWMIGHRFNPTTIEYSSLYLEKELRLKGAAITLLAQSIRLQQASDVPDSVFEINFDFIDPPWRNFVNSRLKPYAQKIENVFVTTFSI